MAEYYVWWLAHAMRASRDASKFGFQSARNFNPRDYKTSETVFLLGSGWSINEIDDQGWDKIKENDSIGFNFWPVHPHRPNLYFFEAANPNINAALSTVVAEQFITMAKSRPDYADIPKIMTDFEPQRWSSVEGLPDTWRQNLFAANTFPMFVRNEGEAKTGMRLLNALGVFDESDDLNLVLKYRATIVMLVSLAVRMGYRRIVLCGIDMSDPRYFYQTPERLGEFQSSQPAPTHATLWEVPMLANVPDILHAMNEVVLKPRGIEIFVENRCSALFPRIPELRARDLGVG